MFTGLTLRTHPKLACSRWQIMVDCSAEDLWRSARNAAATEAPVPRQP